MSVPRLIRKEDQLDNGFFNPYPFVGVNRVHLEAHLTCYHSTGELPVPGVLGDDIKSQVGATIIHRVLTKLFEDRGQPIKRSYQLNVGENTDFLTMSERTRLESKRRSKTRSVLSQMNGMERLRR